MPRVLLCARFAGTTIRGRGKALMLGTVCEVRRAQCRDVCAVHAFCKDQDLWPKLDFADIASMVGRTDTWLFVGWRDRTIAGIAACVQDGESMRLLRLDIPAHHKGGAPPLIAAVESQAKALGSATVFAQVLQDGFARVALAEAGYSEDFREQDVIFGRPVVLVDMIKTMASDANR